MAVILMEKSPRLEYSPVTGSVSASLRDFLSWDEVETGERKTMPIVVASKPSWRCL